MRLPELLNKPILIDGEEVILVEDHIGDSMLDQEDLEDLLEIQPPDATSPGFYVLERDLRAIRTDYPDHRTFGLWQTLYYSNILSGHNLLFLPNTDMDGRYALGEEGLGVWEPIQSGVVSGGLLVGLPSEHLNDAHVLNIKQDMLSRPTRQALLLEEHQALFQRRSKRRYIVTGITCLALVLLTGFVEIGLIMQHRAATIEMNQLKQQEDRLALQVGSLLKSRRPPLAPNREPLSRLFSLYTMDPELRVDKSPFEQNVAAIMSRTVLPLVRTLPWASPIVTDDGQIHVQIVGERPIR